MYNNLKLEIKNFQAISKIDIELKPGITFIVGSSNSSKTSCIRAIKALLTNSSGANRYIKYGEDKASVKLTYKGNIVDWIRTEKGSKYIVNDKEYSKLGSSDLFDIIQNNGFILDDKNNVANIEGEWDVMFPFDRSGSELFKLFENIFCISDSGKIFQSLKQEESDYNKELQENIFLLNQNTAKLNIVNKFLDNVNIEHLKEVKEEFTLLNNEYNKISNDLSILEELYNTIEKLPKNIIIKNFKQDNINEYIKIREDLQCLNNIKEYVKVFSKQDLTMQNFNVDNINKYIRIKEDLQFLKTTEHLPNDKNININSYSLDLINNYISIKKDIEVLQNLLKYDNINIEKSKQFNKDLIEEYENTKKDLITLKTLAKETKKLNTDLKELEESLLKYNEELSKFSACEVCGNILSS
jgi:energy-coupling factor transporter ATP-binding protein EcfA2